MCILGLVFMLNNNYYHILVISVHYLLSYLTSTLIFFLYKNNDMCIEHDYY